MKPSHRRVRRTILADAQTLWNAPKVPWAGPMEQGRTGAPASRQQRLHVLSRTSERSCPPNTQLGNIIHHLLPSFITCYLPDELVTCLMSLCFELLEIHKSAAGNLLLLSISLGFRSLLLKVPVP